MVVAMAPEGPERRHQPSEPPICPDSMTQPVPYLSFPGTCAAAMSFYEQALGGRLVTMMSYGESPMAEQCGKDSHAQILHARLELPGGYALMAGDCPGHLPFEGIKGVMLAISYDSEAEAQRVFATLSAGGQVTMPMQPTFWAKMFGMCTDRFGVSWGVNGAMLPMGSAT